MVHNLLSRQLRAATGPDGRVDTDALLAVVGQAYEEFDRERDVNERASKLMEEELRAANAEAKRESDSVLAAILDNASDGMIAVGQNGLIDMANSAAEKQFAAPRGGLIGRRMGYLLNPVSDALENNGDSLDDVGELTATGLDGRIFPVEFSCTALTVSGARRQLWIVRDISERMRSQREVMESRMRFQDFAEASSDCFWEMNESLNRVEVSSAVETPVEARLRSVLAPHEAAEKPQGLAEDGWRALRHHLLVRQRFRLRLDFMLPDGEPLHISISGKPVFGLDGSFQGYRGTGRDVTREVTARVAARRAERRLIEAMDAGPNAIALLDSQLNLAASNSALRALAATSGHRLIAKRPFADFLSAAFAGCNGLRQADIAQLLRDLADTREMREIALGSAWYLLAVRHLSEGGMVLSFSDVTAMKQREKELADAKLAAESASRLKSQFLATMSHELRTPLNAILGFSEVIRDSVFGQNPNAWEKYGEYAASIHASGRHLLSLISEILDLSKIEAGSYLLEIMTLDLRDVLQGAVTLVSPQAMKAGVELRFAEGAEPLLLAADERAMRQIALNLLANAVKFTPKGGCVSLGVTRGDGTIEFAVSDTGIGIAKEHLTEVFELFRQVDSSIGRRHEGTGLGLAITKRLVEMHGGTIWLESEVAVGTTVRVRLPAKAVPEKVSSAAA